MNTKNQSKAAALAARIIKTSQNTLLIKLRFMDSAIFRLSAKAELTTLAVDGRNIYYGDDYVLRLYKSSPENVNRALLHMVFHCVFRHWFVKPSINRSIWNLAVDIATENIINSLGLNCVADPRAQSKKVFIDEVSRNVRIMNAESVYAYLTDKNLTESQLLRLNDTFAVDDHSCWYNEADFQNQNGSGNGSNGESDPSEGQGAENRSNTDDNQSADNGIDSPSAGMSSLNSEWEDVSRQIEMSLDTFSKEWGIRAGGMTQQLKELNRERYDYSAFLKKFAVMGETMKVNDDEFDYIFYTYGLKLYKNIPLIEPLEYKEEKRIREFVIAIDTSGSTSGETVQKFLNKTYNILKNSESYFSKVNIWIVQCDAKIQEAKKITSQEEFDEYIRNFQIKGLGGTDFRPVFDFVNKLVDDKEFTRLKGVIYFTDGCGIFPQKKPDYETAFVFLQNEYNNLNVPPWAIKLILNSDEI